MTRTEAILRDVSARLTAQRQEIDRRDDIDMVVIKVFFLRGHVEPRAVRISTEREDVIGKVR